MSNINFTFALYKPPGLEYSHEEFYIYHRYADLLSQAFGTTCQSIHNGEFGRRLPDGNWTGIIGQVDRFEADIAVQALYVTEDRKSAFSYSYPLLFEGAGFAIRKSGDHHNAFAVLLPFSFNVWIAFAASIILITLALYFLMLRKALLINIFTEVLATALSQSLDIKNRRKSMSVSTLILCWLFVATIIGMCYKSLLLAVLTLPTITGIQNIKELAVAVEKGQYNCMTWRSSSLSNVLVNSNIESERIIGYNLQNISNEGSIEEYLKLSDSKIAFISSKSDIAFPREIFHVSDDSMYPSFLGLIVRKDFCCKEKLDMIIHRIAQSGLYKKIYRDANFLTVLTSMPANNTERDRTKMSLDELKNAFVILILGLVLACVVLLFEIILIKLETWNLLSVTT